MGKEKKREGKRKKTKESNEVSERTEVKCEK